MALNLDDKKRVVKEVSQYASTALSIVAAEYSCLTAVELAELRKVARKTGVYLRVVKNSLAKKSIANTEFKCMQKKLTGNLILAFSMDDYGAAARLFSNFAKTNDKLITKIVAINGVAHDASELARVASLSTYNQGISLIMATMKAPIQKLANTLFVIKEQMQAASLPTNPTT